MDVALGQSTIDVLTVGASAPAGLDALEVATAVRARRFEPAYLSFAVADHDAVEAGAADPPEHTFQALMCSLPSLPRDCLGAARLLALGGPALREACAGASGSLPLFLALPEPARPGADELVPGDVLAALGAEAEVAIDPGRSRIFREGHAGAASAFAAALELLEGGGAELAVVGGIDTYHQPATVAWLAREGFRHGPERFVPSEGAAFLLLGRHQPDGPRRPLARVCAAMTDRVDEALLVALTRGEDRSPAARVPAIGGIGSIRRKLGAALAAGQTQAWRAHGRASAKPRADDARRSAHETAVEIAATTSALLERLVQAWPGVPVEWVLSDVNNARSRVQEWQTARRALPRGAVDARLIDPLGDLGAATGAMLAVIACSFWRIGCAPAPAALIALHSQLAERGVILLRRSQAGDEAGGAADAAQNAAALPAPKDEGTRAAAAIWLDELGQLLMALANLGDESREGEAAAGALDAAMATIHRLPGVAAGDERALELLDESLARMDEASAHLPAGGGLTERLLRLRGKVAQRRPELLEEAVRGPFVAAPKTPRSGSAAASGVARAPAPFRASGDTPALHHLVPPRLGAFLTRSATRLERADPVDLAPRRAARREAAERHLGAIARLSQTRRATDVFAWSPSLGTFDEALLGHLDAFAALGEHLPADPDTIEPLDELARYASGARSDPDRAFVRTFVLGCQQDAGAVRALVLALRQSDPITDPAQAEALALGSSPAIDEAMQQLCQDADARMVRLALDVLAARRSASFAHVCPLLWHADPSIRRKAAALLGHAHEERDAVVDVLEPLLHDELDDQTSAAAAQSLLVLDVPRALEVVRRWLRDDGQGDGLSRRARRQLLELLALSGAASDLALLLETALPGDADLLGWFGHVGAVEPLCALLSADPAGAPRRRRRRELDSPRQRAARALARLTGATPPTTGLRHRRRPETLNDDPSFWQPWWKEHRNDFAPAQRHRWGKPYEPALTIDELSAPGVPAHLRALATTELALLGGGTPPPWEGDWVGRQLRVLAALRTLLQTKDRSPEPGQWPATTLGRRHRKPRR